MQRAGEIRRVFWEKRLRDACDKLGFEHLA